MTAKIAALFIFDSRENRLVACDHSADPNTISGLVPQLAKLKEFQNAPLGKSKISVDSRRVFCLRTDNKITAACVAEVDSKRERNLFATLHRVLDFPEIQSRPFQDISSLERRLEAEARGLEKDKKDIVEKNQIMVSQVSDKVEAQLQKEYEKHKKLLEVEDEVKEIEVVTGENAAMAQEIKFRSFWEDMKMNALLYGGLAVLVVLFIFIGIKFLPF